MNLINSKYIANILNLLLDGDSEINSIRQQLPFLTDKEYNYTESGLFVTFSHTDEIQKYKGINENKVLNGVKITSSEFLLEADAILFLKEGIIDYLEIWCYQGNYPKNDLNKYTLTQVWKNSPGRQLSTE